MIRDIDKHLGNKEVQGKVRTAGSQAEQSLIEKIKTNTGYLSHKH